MAQGLMDDFLVYKWQYMEDKKQTFIKSLESYLQNVRQKIFARSQDAEDHFVEAVAFLQQPLPDMKGQGSGQCRQDLEERVKFLEISLQRLESSFTEKSEIHKQQVEKIEKKHQQEMEKMKDKMKEQERRSASSVDELKNSFSDLQRNMEEEGNKLEKLKRETEEDSKKRNRQIKEVKSNHKTVLRVCSERLASVGGIMKTVIQLHTATGTAFPTHAVAGLSSGVTTQATPTHAVVGPSSGVTTQATLTHAVARPSSGVTTQATFPQATAASPGLSASAALTTSPGQDRTLTAGKLLNTLTLGVSICDLLLLADGMVLVATEDPDKLRLYDLSGTQLQTMSMNGACLLCKDEDGCVFVLDQERQLKCLEAERKDIKVKTTCRLSTGKDYRAIIALDKTLAVSHFEGVDLINTAGAVLKTFATDSPVDLMCTLPCGDLICCDWSSVISRWNPTTGKRLFQTRVPEVPDPWGVASLPSRTILVGGGRQGTLSLIDERGNFIRHLYKSPSDGIVYQISVQDDTCVLRIYKNGSSSVQVIKLVY